MSTIITTHCKMGIVDPSGNVNVLYPQTTGSDVSITPNATIKSTTVQGMVDEVAALNSDLTSQISNLVTAHNELIRYADVSISSLTFPANVGYLDISNNTPSLTNYTLVYALLMGANGASNSENYPSLQADGKYIFGVGGKTYTQINIRYLFIHLTI